MTPQAVAMALDSTARRPARGKSPAWAFAWARAWACLIAGLLLAGCHAVPVYQQQRVGKPNMQFEESTVFAYSCALLTQVEPGFALSGGAQATTCSACR